MTMTLPVSTPAPDTSASLEPVLRTIIVLVGVIEGLGGLSQYSILFGDISKIPGFSPGGLIILAAIVLHPIFGFAGLAYAVMRRLNYGIIALGLLALTQWASDSSSVIWEGFQISGDTFVNALSIFRTFVQPVIGLAAIAAAWRDRYLAAATIGVMLPTVVDAAGVAGFAIAVMIHGF